VEKGSPSNNFSYRNRSSNFIVSHLAYIKEHSRQFLGFCIPKWRLFLNFNQHLSQMLRLIEVECTASSV
jgi:hypothetical protein